MIALSCDGISLAFGTDIILSDITFSINEGEKLGIVGPNGAGKTTLFRIITKSTVPTSGNIYTAHGKTVGLLEQNSVPDLTKTVFETALSAFSSLLEAEAKLKELSLRAEEGDTSAAEAYSVAHEQFTRDGGYEFRSKCKGILKNLGFPEERFSDSASSLSGGQKTRLALAALLLSEPDILMLDEPTNHLDTDSLFWLEDFLSLYRKTVLVISHDRYFLDRVTGMTLDIENGRAKLYRGNYSQFCEKKKKDREIQENHYKNQQKEIARIEAYITQQKHWNRERNIIAAESRQKQLDKMERIERPDAPQKTVKMRFDRSTEGGQDVLRTDKLSFGYGNAAPLISNASFLIKKHDRAFICGRNGCGKSTLIKLLCGKLKARNGIIEFGTNITFGYYDQENQNLDETKTVLDELWDAYPDLSQTQIRTTLAQFLFTGDDVSKGVSLLSGGEKARLTLAKLMLSKFNLLILDEPTNHLDIGSREMLEEAIRQYTGTVIAVSHDRYFINSLATRILSFGDNGHIEDFKFGYEDYVKHTQAVTGASSKEAQVTASKESYLQTKKEIAERRKLERQLEKAQSEAAEIESEIENVSAELHDDNTTDPARLAELYDKNEKMESRLLELYETIETVSQKLTEK